MADPCKSGPKTAINLSVLRKFDAKINLLLETSGHVTVYEFLLSKNNWVFKCTREYSVI